MRFGPHFIVKPWVIFQVLDIHLHRIGLETQTQGLFPQAVMNIKAKKHRAKGSGRGKVPIEAKSMQLQKLHRTMKS